MKQVIPQATYLIPNDQNHKEHSKKCPGS